MRYDTARSLQMVQLRFDERLLEKRGHGMAQV